MLSVLFAGKLWYFEVVFRGSDCNIETVNVVEDIVGYGCRCIETELETFIVLLFFLLNNGGVGFAHEDFGFEVAGVKLERNAIVHENDKVLVELKDHLSKQGLVETPESDLKKGRSVSLLET